MNAFASSLSALPLLAAEGGDAHAHVSAVSPLIAALSIALIVSGIIFFIGAIAGLVRFPDFYTRMHAAGKGDTLSSLLVIMGFALYHLDSGDWDRAHWLVALKLLAICVFIMITSPTSTHALMNAGYEDGCVPQIGPGGNALEKRVKSSSNPGADSEAASTDES